MLLWPSLLAIGSCDFWTNERWNGYTHEATPSVPEKYGVHATFTNAASARVAVQRIRSAHGELGSMSPTAVLLPGESRKLDCAVGDVFSAISSTGKVLMVHEVRRVHITDAAGCEGPDFRLCRREPFDASRRWTPPDSLVFSNHRAEPVDLYYLDADCEERVAVLQPGASQHIQSTLGHAFRARRNATILLQHRLLPITIRDLDTDDDRRISGECDSAFAGLHLDRLREAVDGHMEMIRGIQSRMSLLSARELLHNETSHVSTCAP